MSAPRFSLGSGPSKVATYPVSGRTGFELYRSVGDNGPVITGDRRTIAHTTFKLTWRRDYQERADGSCVIASNIPRLIIHLHAAQAPRRTAAGGWRRAGKRFHDGLAAHERVLWPAHHRDGFRRSRMSASGSPPPLIRAATRPAPSCRPISSGFRTKQRARGRDFDRVEMGDGGAVQNLVLGLVNGP